MPTSSPEISWKLQAPRAGPPRRILGSACHDTLHAAALLRLGRTDEAKSMARQLLELQPGFTVSGLVSGNITTPERMDLLAGSLRELGLPE